MPNFLNNLGLEAIFDDDEIREGFIRRILQEGTALNGYYGCPTIFSSPGDIDLFVKTQKTDDGKLEIVGLDTHSNGMNVWEMRNTGIDITPKDSLPTERVFFFKNHSDGSGMIPIHLVNADILPSFLEDDVVKMQMCAFPVDIKYYENEDEYVNAQQDTPEGKRWLLADGSLLPIYFMNNHAVESADDNKDYSTDDYVMFKATVKRIYKGYLGDGEDAVPTHIRCVVDTPCGELIFSHTVEQVAPEQRDKLHIGAVIFGVCVLSGDVSIYEYGNGLVKDFDNNLRLLRQVIVNGQAERMRSVLCEDAVYISDSSKAIYKGIDEIIERFNYVHDAQKDRCFATPATITSVDSEDLEYGVGTRCLLISYKTEYKYSAIAFIDVTDDGDIKRIYISTDKGYHFKPDEKIRDASSLDDIELPESVFKPIYNRAIFHGLIDEDLDLDTLIHDMTQSSTWQNNAKCMLEALQENPQPDVEVAFENMFGYLFAKAIEKTINENKREGVETILTATYVPEEAFKGELHTTFDEELHGKIVLAMEKGKQFYKDFKFFMLMGEPDDEKFINEVTNALTLVQEIGSLYAIKLVD